MSRLIRYAAPAGLPVTLAGVKTHLRITGDEHDDELNERITHAVDQLDGFHGTLGRAIVQQTWDLWLDQFPRRIIVPLPPLISVDAITYFDGDGAEQTLSASIYQILRAGEERPAVLVEAEDEDWPDTRDAPESVKVRFTCGYAPSEDSPPDYGANVPASLKLLIYNLIEQDFDRDERALVVLKAQEQRLVGQWKVGWL